MSKGDGTFADVINDASARPDDLGEGASHELPSMFKPFPIPEGDHVENIPDPNKIQGIPAYKYTARFKRFLMGPISKGRDDKGMPIIEEHDDSIAYQAVLDEVLAGHAVLRWEDKKFTNEGGFIVAMTWLVKKDNPKPKPDVLDPQATDRH